MSVSVSGVLPRSPLLRGVDRFFAISLGGSDRINVKLTGAFKSWLVLMAKGSPEIPLENSGLAMKIDGRRLVWDIGDAGLASADLW